jgi:hypothetical protein
MLQRKADSKGGRSMGNKILVFNPTGVRRGKSTVGARRLATLQGKQLAVIWNGKLGGDVFLKRVSEVLADRYGVSGIEWVSDRGDTNKVIGQAVVDRIVATCDGAVIGTGD